jgi:hypothetical protein
MEPPKKVINYILSSDIVGRKFISRRRRGDFLSEYNGQVYTVIGRDYKEGRRSRLEGLSVAFGDGRQVTFNIEECYGDTEVVPAQPPQIT